MKLVLCFLVCFLCSTEAKLVCSSANDDPDTAEKAYADKLKLLYEATNRAAIPSATHGYPDYACEINTPEPSNIHTLSPEHISVVAAMGDSITAGFGAASETIEVVSYRGLSWSIGGDETLDEVATLPNVVKIFNPSVQGYSILTGLPSDPNSNMNRAVGGARSKDILSQAEDVVSKLIEKSLLNAGWKVVTLWIGGNDLCAIQIGEDPETLATGYVDDIELGLDFLFSHVPQVFVNLVGMLDVTVLKDSPGPVCNFMHTILCNCITKPRCRLIIKETYNLFNQKLNQLIDSGKYERNDFTVVFQPFFVETKGPKYPDGSMDMTYFAPDCFHFSRKGHEIGARYLWNNMMQVSPPCSSDEESRVKFEAIGSKTDQIYWLNFDPLSCPDQFPYLRTKGNSQNPPLSREEL